MKFTAIKNLIQPALKVNKRNLVIVFLVSFLFRLLVAVPNLINPENAFTGDSLGYVSLASSIKQLSFPNLFRTPGYPLFIALTTTSLLPGNVIFTLLMQMLLDSIASLLVVGICRRLFSLESAAMLAGFFYAFSPVAAANSALMMSESLQVFFTLSAIYILVSSDSVKALIGQGVFWGLATLTRPSALLFPIISYFLINTKKIKLGWKKQTVAVIIYALIVFGWLGFNYARTGKIFLSTLQHLTVWKYELSAVQMLEDRTAYEYMKLWVTDPRTAEPIRDKYEAEFFRQVYNKDVSSEERWSPIDSAEISESLQNEAQTRLKGRYLSIAIVHFTGALQIFRPISPTASSGITGTILDALRLILFSLSVIILLWKRELSFWTFISVTFWLVYTFFLPGVNGVWRFRGIGEPVICIITSLGILSLVGMNFFAERKDDSLNKINAVL